MRGAFTTESSSHKATALGSLSGRLLLLLEEEDRRPLKPVSFFSFGKGRTPERREGAGEDGRLGHSSRALPLAGWTLRRACASEQLGPWMVSWMS